MFRNRLQLQALDGISIIAESDFFEPMTIGSLITRQVANGVAVRMAVLFLLLGASPNG